MYNLKSLKAFNDSFKLNELEFTDREDFVEYSSKHDIRDTTSVTIAGKVTTAGKAKTEDKPKKQVVKKISAELRPELCRYL